jgi:hypothetical protein
VEHRLRNWLPPAIVGLLAVWFAAGAPPFGRAPYWERGLLNNNMGFGNDWDCPPTIDPAATVCIKRPRTAIPAHP